MQSKQADVFELFSTIYNSAAQEEMSLQQYLLACREDKSMYGSAPERMVDARQNRPQVIQSADLFVDANGIMYATDYNAGLSIMEYLG